MVARLSRVATPGTDRVAAAATTCDTAEVFATLAQTRTAPTGDLTEIVWQTPVSPLGWLAFLSLFGLAAAAIIALQRRDTRELGPTLRVLLPALRLLALAALAIIYLNPQERTVREAFEPSQVSVLVDVSGSMQQPAVDPDEVTAESPTRQEALRDLLDRSDLLAELRNRHAVTVYAFGESVGETKVRLPYAGPMQGSGEGDSTEDGAADRFDWDTFSEPRDTTTRLGDAVEQVLATRVGGRDVGVIVLTDGANNAGQDVRAANARAIRDEVRLIAVGFGGIEPASNVSVTRLIVPTDVQAGDAFGLTAYLQGQGVAGERAEVRLAIAPRAGDEGSKEEEVIATETVTLPDDGQPLAVAFEDRRTDEGEVTYRVAVTLDRAETRSDDNAAERTVRIFDRPFSVLMVAGGPSRDYRFARNALFRHPSAEIDIWLQSAPPGISQESRELLFQFPERREDLFTYDVIVAFDADWSTLSDEQIAWLQEWIGTEGGGLVAEVGDVYTPVLAGVDERLDPVRSLYPVVLEPVRLSLTTSRDRNRIFPLRLTDDGRAADFLELGETATGEGVWDRFTGVYGAYPTSAVKAGATVFAEFPNPLVRGASGPPPLIAEQRYGQGTVVYLGTSEMWRLRSVAEDAYDRFWVKLVRRAGQGRSRQGLQRAIWLLDGRDQPLGQTVTLRARVLSPQFTPLETTELPITLRTPDGQVLSDLTLTQDPRRPAEFVGQVRPSQAGRYQVELVPPDATAPVVGELRVELPQAEAAKLEQDATALARLVEETGGAYLTPSEAAAAIPDLLPAAGQSVMIDRQLRDLWDRWWVLAALVGLLGLEWLIRKLVALA